MHARSHFHSRLDARAGIKYTGHIQADVNDIRFGFFGELGYGLLGWWPFIKHIQESGGFPVKTAGLPGSGAFLQFSADHLEIDVATGNMWGSRSQLIQAAKHIDEPLLVAPLHARGPSAQPMTVNGRVWKHNTIHQLPVESNYAPLAFSATEHLACGIRDTPYVLVNHKDYFNWGNTSITNAYSTSDLVLIRDWADRNGFVVLYNRFPAPNEPSNLYFDTSKLDSLVSSAGFIDLGPIYGDLETLTERNRLQLAYMLEARHIFATQGGNAVISLMSRTPTTVLMRGGFDYPDYLGVSNLYEVDLSVVYDLSHSLRALC